MRRSRAAILAEFVCSTCSRFDGIASGCHLAQPREGGAAAWAILADWQEERLLLWRPAHQGGHGELPRVLPGHAPARLARPAPGGHQAPRRDPAIEECFPRALAASAAALRTNDEPCRAGCPTPSGRIFHGPGAGWLPKRFRRLGPAFWATTLPRPYQVISLGGGVPRRRLRRLHRASLRFPPAGRHTGAAIRTNQPAQKKRRCSARSRGGRRTKVIRTPSRARRAQLMLPSLHPSGRGPGRVASG